MKIDELYLEVNNDEIEVGRSRLGLGFRSESTLNEGRYYYDLMQGFSLENVVLTTRFTDNH